MIKSRSACKPARLAGSGRKLTRALADKTSLEDNECMKASKEICYGLAVFQATFGCDRNEQESSFHGFSPHEIRLARDKSEIRTNQVEREHRARGVLFTPYTFGRRHLMPVSSLMTASRKSNCDVQPHNLILEEKKSSHLNKVSDLVHRKTNGEYHVQRTKKCIEKVVGTTNVEGNNRAIARKFVLPVRSAHSSRVIKPNKRFRDIDLDDASCDVNDSRLSKKLRLASDTFSDDSSSSWLDKGKDDSSQVSTDGESNSVSECWSSSASTTSSSLKDEQIPSNHKTKVVLRKAKLKVDPDPPAVKGPFSCDQTLVPQKMVCGVCGGVKYYRHLKQARKFGIYSCESCRKFISKMISQQSSTQVIDCRVGNGNCLIPQYLREPGVTPSRRCEACWLKMCLNCYCMPEPLFSRLTRRLPVFMKSFDVTFSNTVIPKSEFSPRMKNKLKNLKASPNMPCKVTDKMVEKQIILAKNIRRKAEAIVRKDNKSKEASNNSATKKKVLVTKLQSRTITNKTKSNFSKVKSKEENKGNKTSNELSLKRKRVKKEKGKREEKLIRLHKLNLKGPRVKHVCRSASLVLGQPVATFTDTSPSKQKDPHSGKEYVDENAVMTLQMSGSDRQLDGVLGYTSPKATEPSSRIRQASDDGDLHHPGKKNSTAKQLIAAESTEEGLLDGKARTLQDLTRQHHELINGATMEDDVSLISIDFWESYDPEAVCRTGFALIGIGDAFSARAICFICGSAGLDKLIHCACCCEPYHHYCVESSSNSEGGDWWLVDWVCARCTLCHACGQGGSVQVSCQRCHKSYHTECITDDRLASRLHSTDRPWVCLSCLCCKSCNQAEVYKFVGNLPLCRVCFKLRQKGNFCPLCQRCYDENDFDTKMMECERCKCWVHAKCEGLSNEKYQILSILPDSVEFICRLCCKAQPAPWWLAVESEMKAGYLAVLKSLSKNRKVCDLLKWSPTKRSSLCVCARELSQRALRFPDLSEQSDAESADMRVQNERQRDETVFHEEECCKNLQTHSAENEENLVSDPKNQNSEKHTAVCDLRTKYSVHECSVLVKNDDLHLKLDSDAIGYQNSEEKPSQFSPHATSQSDSGIGSTDDELKSTNDQCFCLGLEVWTKAPLTLLTIKKKVNANEYSSLNGFNKDMEEMITSIQGTELLKIYQQSLKDTFPWFNPKCDEVFDPPTSVTHSTNSTIALKAILEEKPGDGEIESVSVVLKEKLNKDNDYYYTSVGKPDDFRLCILCKLVGEGKPTEEGRLLYCGQNEWVHTNCALWSNEVFEEIDGSLQNVQSAISRSRHIRCSKCSKKGASVGCCNRSCPEAFHFSCAQKSDCIFFEDKSLFCVNHKNDAKVSRLLETGPDFLVSRPVYVELERKKKKYVAKHNVQIMIGSLVINNIGEFVPEVSDQESSIVPSNFQCTRMFWSSVEPWRLVQYRIRTKIVYTVSDESMEDDKNFTIDHSLWGSEPEQEKIKITKNYPNYANDTEVKEVMEHILDVVSSKDEEAAADLLPPELKEAIFEDLPHDLLDGISMQDIFYKLMSFDSTAPEIRPDKEIKTALNTKSQKTKGTEKTKPGLETDKTVQCYKLSMNTSDSRIKADLHSKSNNPNKTKFMDYKEEKNKSENELGKKDNTSNWSSTKILQIDGAGDCSSSDYSSDPGSPVRDGARTPFFKTGHLETVNESHTNSKTCILQFGGIIDLCTSTSNSESGSPTREDESLWKLGQVDGASDFCSGKDKEILEENPVKCTRCHRTYRTAQSFERHLQTCSVDYILSCSESDSSEEEKISSSEVKLTDLEDVTSDRVSPEIPESKDKTKEEIITESENHLSFDFENHQNNLSVKSSEVRMYNNNKAGLPKSVCSNVQNQVLLNHSNITSKQYLESSPEKCINVNTQLRHQTYSAKPKTIRAMFECEESQIPNFSKYGRTSPVRNPPIKTYARRKKVNTTTLQATKSSQAESMIEYQTTPSPALIIQQVPSHSLVPSFVESLPHQSSANNIQYQYITTLDMQDKSQIPMAIQLQSPINIQPMMPTVLGTIIQPNGVEQLVVNTGTPTVEMLNQQPANVYITNMNQPMYVGMETVVSNTVMSSSQFVSGILTGSSYSATTTQVYQTAKPVIDLPQSYVVVNAQTNHVPETIPQTMYSSQTSHPWTYNYQETYKVKERTTYQQVTRQIIQEENNVECVKKVNSSDGAIFLEKPLLQEVTVQKTHSIHKAGVPTLPSATSNTSPLLINGRVSHENYPHEKSKLNISFTDSIRQNKKPQQTTNPPRTYISRYDEQNLQIKSLENATQKREVTLETKSRNISPQKAVEITKKYVKQPENQTQITSIEKQTKPVITKVKSNPNVKNCNFSVNFLKVKTNHSNDKNLLPSEQDKKTFPISSEPVEVPLKSPEISSCDNIIGKQEKYVKSEKTKSVVDERVPLKENKVVNNKSKISGNSSKKSSHSSNLTNPKLVYEISSQDGINICSQDLAEAMQKIFEAVQSARAAIRLPPLPHNPLKSHLKMLGLDNNSVKYLVEQLPGVGNSIKYKPIYHKSKLFGHSEPLRENPTGCARSEPCSNSRRKYDMFSWLASRHRRPPKLIVNSETEIVNGISRRATSLNLPMAMRFRHLKETSREAVGVFRSDIHGRGLFCLRDIDSGEMVIEYAGEVIRAGLTDKREHYYTSKGIGCYMFRIDDQFVVDATMHGNAARFINHSCEPNCYSRVVDILGKKHILIFALRKIPQGEELTYDYKFPLEDDKITCHCLSRKCRKYLN